MMRSPHEKTGGNLGSGPDWPGRMMLTGIVVFWLATVAFPIAAGYVPPLLSGISQALTTSTTTSSSTSAAWSWSMAPRWLAASFFWGTSIAAGAVVFGIPAGLILGGACRRTAHRFIRPQRILLMLMIAAMCLPAYMTYWAWGLTRLPGSFLAEWAASGQPWRSSLLSHLQLWWGMTLWAWPISALALAGAIRAIPRAVFDQLCVDGAGAGRRLYHLLLMARHGIVLGFGLVFVATMTSYAAFDLAWQNRFLLDTYGNALRRLAVEADRTATAVASTPLLILMLGVTWLVTRALARPPQRADSRTPTGALATYSRSYVTPALAVAVVLCTFAVPCALMISHLSSLAPLLELRAIEGRAIAASLRTSMVAGLILGAIALTLAAGWSHQLRLVRRLCDLLALGWIWVGLLPAAATGAMLVVAYNRPGLGFIYDSALILVLGYVARYALVAVLIGRWIAVNEPETSADLRRLDGAVSLINWVKASGYRLGMPLMASVVIGSLLSLSEVSTTMIVLPPGVHNLSQNLLNKMHYAREDSAIATCLALFAIVLTGGMLSGWALQWLRLDRADSPLGNGADSTRSMPARIRTRRSRLLMVLLLAPAGLTAIVGCDSDEPPKSANLTTAGPLRPTLSFGSVGREFGQFIYPRAMDFDVANQWLYIVDKSGRIQRFSWQGELSDSWTLPKYDMGYPTGISVNPDDGRVYLADTHNHRVLVFSPEGEIVASFGEYGLGPGQMVYPTDVAFGPDGRLYVSEYGGNDRIQVFDAGGRYLFGFGEHGSHAGQFSRPQSVAFDRERSELWIADSCNHRIVITDASGKWKRTIGGAGAGPGKLSYPYGIVLQPDGSVLVCEFGNNRVQHLAPDGECLGLYGTAGVGAGQLAYPWAIAADGERLYVLDSGNNRVQVVSRP